MAANGKTSKQPRPSQLSDPAHLHQNSNGADHVTACLRVLTVPGEARLRKHLDRKTPCGIFSFTSVRSGEPHTKLRLSDFFCVSEAVVFFCQIKNKTNTDNNPDLCGDLHASSLKLAEQRITRWTLSQDCGSV
ncbi:hypothetical protein Q7C36_002621 [Tachysurus vachellii]|uniref:Uncharacterized protein n=1 Tax=Tachysurus vachellii TaxID=175792 RepID=A0AA88NXX2_TACVA|nr:hypothetical protein Q7C36_002621 [Tachysurus vachellii]